MLVDPIYRYTYAAQCREGLRLANKTETKHFISVLFRTLARPETKRK